MNVQANVGAVSVEVIPELVISQCRGLSSPTAAIVRPNSTDRSRDDTTAPTGCREPLYAYNNDYSYDIRNRVIYMHEEDIANFLLAHI